MQLTLTPEIEIALQTEAHQRGTTPEKLALASLQKLFVTQTQPDETSAEGETLADFWAPFIGVLHSSDKVAGGARMSENTGDKFAALMVKKRAQGQL